jgi:hypothetical protein
MSETRKPIDIAFPFFLLKEGYRQFLMSGLGEMVLSWLSGLVNDWRERAKLDSIPLLAERLRLLGEFPKSDHLSSPMPRQRWNNVADYRRREFIRRYSELPANCSPARYWRGRAVVFLILSDIRPANFRPFPRWSAIGRFLP